MVTVNNKPKINLIIFPNQLFEVGYLPKISTVQRFIFWKIQSFSDIGKKMKFHKLKLILHRASMKSYEEYLTRNGFSCEYIEVNDLTNLKYTQLSKVNDLCIFETNDHLWIND